MRFGCGYPMGPLALLDLIGLDTAYEILDTMYKQGRDRLHAPAPILKQMVTAGLLGRKTGRGFYTYEAPDCPVVVADALTPSADAAPQLRHDIRTGRRGRHRHDGDRHRRGVRQGRVRRHLRRPRQDKVDGVRATIEKSLDKAIQRGKIEESARDARARPAHRLHPPRRPRRRRPRGRGDRRGPDVKTALFENLDEICKPGAILATTTSSLPVIALAGATRRPQDVIGMHFFNPAPVMKLVEVVSHGQHRRRGRRDRAGAVRRGRQGRGLLRRPGRLHRQRAAVPLPQRRGEDARGALRDAPTTSTPR